MTAARGDPSGAPGSGTRSAGGVSGAMGRALASVAAVPNGTVLDTPGYDAMSRILYQPSPDLKMRPIPEDPETDEIQEAVAVVEDAIGEFPFCGPADRANMYALLLTPLIRPAISGCTPIALIDAPQAGTGKSLLANVLSVIVSGREAAFMNMPKSEEEIQKGAAWWPTITWRALWHHRLCQWR